MIATQKHNPFAKFMFSNAHILFHIAHQLQVRLQYSDDERLLGPALAELAGAVAADAPAEALLQRRSLLVSLVIL